MSLEEKQVPFFLNEYTTDDAEATVLHLLIQRNDGLKNVKLLIDIKNALEKENQNLKFDLSRANAEHSNQLAARDATIGSLQQEVSSLKDQLNNAFKQNQEQAKSILELLNESKTSNAELKSAKDEAKDLHEQLNNAQSIISAQTGQIKQGAMDVSALQAQIEVYRSNEEKLYNQLVQAEQQSKSFEEQLNTCEQRFLQKHMQTMETINLLTEENQKTFAQFKQLQDVHNQLQARYTKLKQQYDSTASKMDFVVVEEADGAAVIDAKKDELATKPSAITGPLADNKIKKSGSFDLSRIFSSDSPKLRSAASTPQTERQNLNKSRSQSVSFGVPPVSTADTPEALATIDDSVPTGIQLDVLLAPRRTLLGATAKPPTVAKRVMKDHGDVITSIRHNQMGNHFATGSGDKTVKLWDYYMGNHILTFDGPSKSITCVDISPNDDFMAATCNDQKIWVWRLTKRTLEHTLTGHTGEVSSCTFISDGRTLITGGADRRIKYWDVESGFCNGTIECASKVRDVCWGRDGLVVLSTHYDKSLRLYSSPSNQQPIQKIEPHSALITSVQMSPDTNTILTNSRDNTLKLIDYRTFEVVTTFKSKNYRNAADWSTASFSPDGQFVAAGSGDGTLCIWSVKQPTNPTVLTYNGKVPAVCCSWNPHGHQITTGHQDGTVVLWES